MDHIQLQKARIGADNIFAVLPFHNFVILFGFAKNLNKTILAISFNS
jgi:hypothetical protein